MSLNLSTDLPGVFVEGQTLDGIHIFAAIALGFIGFFGFMLNFLVIVVIIKDSAVLWTPNNVILVNMAVGDILVAILGNPVAMTSAIAGIWYWSHKMCLWYAWFMTTMGFLSIGNLTIVAVERFLLVTQPMRTLSIRHAYILAFLAWIYALFLSLPPFFNWGKYGLETGNISCSVSWEHHDPETYTDTYIAFIFIVGFLVPVTIIVSSYYGIIKTLKNMKKRIGRTNKRETKVTKMILLMVIAFLIAWMPYAILAIAIQYFHIHVSDVVMVLPALLAKSSICYNPIIYVILNVQFSHVWKKIFLREDILYNKNSMGAFSRDGTAMVTIT